MRTTDTVPETSAMPALAALRPRALSLGLALVAGTAVAASGLMGPRPLPILGWAAAFVFLVVESDVRCRRIPNWVTLPALGLALGLALLSHGPAGLAAALLGVASAFGLLLVPYAVGALGAGDVKAAMALGALLGPSATLAVLAFALGFGGLIALLRVAASGQVRDVLRRWYLSVASFVATRRWVFLRAEPGSAADGGIPFAVALGFAVAAELVREGVR